MRGGITTTTEQYHPPQQDLNINDVLEVIRHTDPATFHEFQNHLTVMASQQKVTNSDLNRQKKQAYVKILEQPASKGLRFRYECEGRSAGSIPGANCTNEKKTFPTIEIVGYTGRAVVVVSCVTADPPYRPHPHNLVGKEGCKKGVCTLEISPETMQISFQSLGIQCVKKKEIEEALTLRQQIRVDPFQTGFSHKDNAQSLDLNCVRLCFQVFLEGSEKGAFTFALKPVVSDPIFDKKAKNDLTICRMTEYSASVAGGKEMLLFCDKVIKDDIQVRFYQEMNGQLVWEGLGDFQPCDVHKQFGIAFKTPRYKDLEIEQSVKVKIHLRRPSDGAVSESRNFEFLPLDSGRSFWANKRLKTNYNIFNSILTASGGGTKINEVMASQEELKRKIRAPHQGAASSMAIVTTTQSLDPSTMTSSFPPPPASARNYHTLSMVPHSSLTPQQQTENAQLLAVDTSMGLANTNSASPNRPLSQISDASTATNATDATKQSVNEILSLAGDQEDISVYSMNLNDALESGGDMSFSALMKMDQAKLDNLTAIQPNPRQPVTSTVMGSMTSVATVRENKSPSEGLQPKPDVAVEPGVNLDETVMDVDALYDDVMQCVYDDVDTKYDCVDFSGAPPQIPTRQRKMSVEVELITPTSPEKPLPGTPSKMPTLITKLTKKDADAIQRKKDLEEQKKREKAEKEAEKQRVKEEKEKQRQREKEEKEKEKQRKVEEAEKKKKEEAEKKKKKNTKNEEEKKKLDSENANTAKPNLTLMDNLNDNSMDSLNGNNSIEPTEEDLTEIQNFLESGNLDHLDNMVNDFAKQYMPDSTLDPSNPPKNANASKDTSIS
ncbi:hypothetical protein TCAL_06620 [Tigriopus californicus]|uniref:RHD domain-containing protein n=1 Tax=Tigriopus californicus TaxID=6832 RepID=A0A553PK35_TIGCA|nr:hypothetical protein TCAL_06620 [Tigriopus californicus]